MLSLIFAFLFAATILGSPDVHMVFIREHNREAQILTSSDKGIMHLPKLSHDDKIEAFITQVFGNVQVSHPVGKKFANIPTTNGLATLMTVAAQSLPEPPKASQYTWSELGLAISSVTSHDQVWRDSYGPEEQALRHLSSHWPTFMTDHGLTDVEWSLPGYFVALRRSWSGEAQVLLWKVGTATEYSLPPIRFLPDTTSENTTIIDHDSHTVAGELVSLYEYRGNESLTEFSFSQSGLCFKWFNVNLLENNQVVFEGTRRIFESEEICGLADILALPATAPTHTLL